MINLPVSHEAYAVIDTEGVFLECSLTFHDFLCCGEDIKLVGTHIEKWLKPQLSAEVRNWYNGELPGKGRMNHVQKGCNYYYTLEPLKQKNTLSGSILFISKENPDAKSDFYALYAHAFHLNPGLSAITVLATGEHIDVNQAWLDAMGYERSEVIGKTSIELGVWEDGEQARAEVVKRLLECGNIGYLEARLRTKNGEILNIIVHAKLLEYQGRILAFFTSHDVTAIKRADQCRIQLEDEVKHWQSAAYIDALTRVANRRRFEEAFEIEWKRCKRYAKPLSMLLIDIDHFKMFNDFYGHIAGDECLRAVAYELGLQIKRPIDLFFRFGGEEFGCLLPETDIDGAKEVANRMLQCIRELKIPHEKSPVKPYVTISIGLACISPSEDMDITQVMQEVDRQLYCAKEKGRNRIYLQENS